MTPRSLFNEHWYRVRGVLPLLAPDVEVSRHIYRGQPHYILRRASMRNWHRLSARAYEIVVQFDGTLSVEDIWQEALAGQGEHAPDQGEVIALLAQLHEADMLVVDKKLDSRLLHDRKERVQRRDKQQRFWNPLHVRIALLDPDRLITRLDRLIPGSCLLPMMGALFLLWLLALLAIAPQWEALTEHLQNNGVFDPVNLILMGLIYPIMKLLHELAHALVVKRYGGDVRESGIAMLVLFPNPYVDASAGTMLSNKYQRMLVSSAGIVVELSLAAIAVLVWLSSTGVVRDAALSVMLLGTVSTLLFNGNPLLKFDGYYVLCDWLEIPNLATRSKQYLSALAARTVGFTPSVQPVPVDSRERLWLISYGIMALVYRLVLMALIAWMISGEYFFFGAILSLYVVFSLLVLPVWKLIRFTGKQAAEVKIRFTVGAAVFSSLMAGAVIAVPLPGTITTDGIVWLPEQSVLRLEQACEVVDVFVEPGTAVSAGQRLFSCADEYRVAQERTLKADLHLIDAERAGLLTRDPAKHKRLSSLRVAAQDKYDLALKRLSAMHVTAPVGGQFLIDGSSTLIGRYLPANSIAGYVVPATDRTIRLALTQTQAARIANGNAGIHVYSGPGKDDSPFATTTISRQTPKATRVTSITALTTLGGGELRAEPDDTGGVLEQAVFDLELAWPEQLSSRMIGSRLRVRIEHEAASLRQRWSTQVRLLLQERADS